jgi:hypothetical protein
MFLDPWIRDWPVTIFFQGEHILQQYRKNEDMHSAQVGCKPMIPVFDWYGTVLVLYHTITVISTKS